MDNDTLNFCINTESVYGVLNIFKNNFLDSFKNIKINEQAPVIKAMPYLYRMWYYTTLINGTALSPANFISHQINKQFDDETIVVPTSSPVYKNKKLIDFQFEYLFFNIDNHPVLQDLKLFLEHCTPDIGVDESGLLLVEERDKIINSFSFKEIFYITFLTNTCYSLNLLKKMRGINTFRAMPELHNIDEFFKLSNIEQLQEIADATINSASKALNSLLPYDKKTFSKPAITKLFTNSLDLDEYMEGIYKKFNIVMDDLDSLDLSGITDLKDIQDLESLNISEETITSIFTKLELSFIMDAYLLTPLGYYLQLIQPIYFENTDFDVQFQQLIQSSTIPDFPLIKLFFTISSCYDITSIGRNVLLDGAYPKNEYQKLTDLPDYNAVYKDILNCSSEIHNLAFGFDKEFVDALNKLQSTLEPTRKSKLNSPISLVTDNKTISDNQVAADKNKAYSFKVKHFYNKRSYKVIELRCAQTLEDLANAIIVNFDLDYGHLYSFFMSNKPYDSDYEITCPFSDTNKNITPKYKINSLSLYEKQKFLFIYDFGDDIRFEIEFISTDEIQKNVKYPRITKQSKN